MFLIQKSRESNTNWKLDSNSKLWEDFNMLLLQLGHYTTVLAAIVTVRTTVTMMAVEYTNLDASYCRSGLRNVFTTYTGIHYRHSLDPSWQLHLMYVQDTIPRQTSNANSVQWYYARWYTSGDWPFLSQDLHRKYGKWRIAHTMYLHSCYSLLTIS